MPARVHAILVVRPEGRATSASHLRRTLAALRDQTRPVDALTIVLCGADAELTDIAASSGAEGIITTSHGTGFAAATVLATPRLTGDAVWLLAQDTAPEPEALGRLAGALELAASVAFVAPKLVRWDDRSEIVSLGVSMTRYGRTVDLTAGDLDQGQHDGLDDVLGTDVRGILVRREAWRQHAGLDPALAGADEGLDLGVRARLAGERVSVAPTAIVAVAGDGVAGLPARRPARRHLATRVAELHRRLVYAPAAAVVLHWLSLLPLALWRTAVHLFAKEPGRVGPEWAATFVVLVRWGAVARARGRMRATRRTSWTRLAALRVSRSQLRLRWDDDGVEPDAPVRSDLRFFTGGGAWTVLGALAVSVAAFPALLAWPVLGGGALAPLRTTVAQLWADAAYGPRALGLAETGPADPFATVVAVLGSLSPFEPSRALVILWLLALPLAVLGGWFAATRVTERSSLRIVAALAWGLAPTFLVALSDGIPSAVLVHLLLPWLFFSASVAHRSWAAAGSAALLVAAVVACAPSLAPALVLVWAAMLLLDALVRHGRGIARIVWLVIPAAVFFAPLVWRHAREGSWWGLLADPGVPLVTDGGGASAAVRAFLAAGFPTSDPTGWAGMLGLPAWTFALLSVPVGVLALLSLLSRRWIAGVALVAIALLGLGTAFAVVGIEVAVTAGGSVGVWPGSALSLAWIGAVGAAVAALDAVVVRRAGVVRAVAAAVVIGALAVAAIPALTAFARETTPLTNGPRSTLPAYVAAAARDDPRLGTMVLAPGDEGFGVTVVWGASETLGGQSTLALTRSRADDSDAEIAALVADLVTVSTDDAITALADHGIGYILLARQSADEAAAAQALRLAAETALDQRAGLDVVGETDRGDLWRIVGDVSRRAEPSSMTRDLARAIGGVQLAVVLVSLLLAIPTAATRRAARRSSRVVGPVPPEVR